ncbi:MAG: PDZ domain-containing protein [Phycisphaerae bacterium]|nr:PDZ domain-containing protein [Phycisphaerae bacterium]
MNSKSLTLLSLVGPALIATMAAAQNTNVTVNTGGGTAKATATSKASSTGAQNRESETASTISVSEGDTKVEITSKVRTYLDAEGNEKRDETKETRVFVAGKEIPANRVRQAGDALQVLDESGAVIRTINVPNINVGEEGIAGLLKGTGSMAGGSASSSASGRSGATSRSGSTARSGRAVGGVGPIAVRPLDAALVTESPKVMLGITMELPDTALADHLRLKADEVTMVGTVNADTPAAKAGLQKHDIIVSVDGSKPASPTRLREVLRAKEPGQSLGLGVFSGGSQKDVTVTLEAYDPTKLGLSADAGQTMVFSFDENDPLTFVQGSNIDPEKLRKMVEQMQQRMGRDVTINIDELFAPADPGQPGAAPRGFYRFQIPAQPTPPVPPSAPSGAAESAEARVRELEARIQSLTETIRRLEEKLNAASGAPGKGA